VQWACGITTVPERFATLLPLTLKSLEAAGFDKPRLFIDGDQAYSDPAYPQTLRGDRIRTFGNWILGLWELNLRYPEAERFAMFQDDVVAYRNLRAYLDLCKYPDNGFWNLYTAPHNERGVTGWTLSNQLGKGALAYVFNREAARKLLTLEYEVTRPTPDEQNPDWWKGLDGAVVCGMKKSKYSEYVHQPTLVQHTGKGVSVMDNKIKFEARTFRGEDFDALRLPR
jgi:hypothetical protein